MLITLLASLTAPTPAAPNHRVFPDVSYRRIGAWQGQLDVYVPTDAGPRPALIYFHGGEWRGGSRKAVSDHLAPYLARGFVVVAVGYRGAKVALAPAAVTDARCAYHWVVNNAPRYGIDRKRVVLSGHSAGGHLALITGYLTPAAKLDGECKSDRIVKPAAAVAWNAPSDLKQYMFQRLADGAPIDWLQAAVKTPSLADAISPIAHARKGVPPTISLHAAGDPEVPHSQATKLHRTLSSVNVLNELVTLQSQGHFTSEHPPLEVARAYDLVFKFLSRSGVLTGKSRRKASAEPPKVRGSGRS